MSSKILQETSLAHRASEGQNPLALSYRTRRSLHAGVPQSTPEYKWILPNLILGYPFDRLACHPGMGRNIPNSVMTQKPVD